MYIIKGNYFLLYFLSCMFVFACKSTKVKTLHSMASSVSDSNILIAPQAKWLHNNKMGPFVYLKDGSILTVDTLNASISKDGGNTWENYQVFADTSKFFMANEKAIAVTQSGTIIISVINMKEKVMNWDKKISDAPGAKLPTYTIRSTDGGKTWKDLRKHHDDWTGANRDMIVTKKGTVILSSMRLAHNPAHHTVLTYSSKDEGITWMQSNIIDKGGIGDHSGVTEATIQQLNNGNIWMLMRTNWGKFWQATSTDEGLTWTDIKATNIEASSAPGMLKRLKSGRLILVWNRPFPEGETSFKLTGGDNQWSDVASSNYREELSAAISEDDGITWSKPVVIAKSTREIGMNLFRDWIAYPYVFEVKPGVLWITTMQSKLRIELNEKDIIVNK
ncbi:MAG: sialidase family protein [Ginsengibacter sp.]